jgi:site-specific DNA-methyltransferase (adenine-specific)
VPETATPDIALVPQRYEEYVDFAQLTPHPANPNEGDLGLLDQLLRANGFAGAILAQESTGIIIDGEQRMKTARGLGLTGGPVIWLAVDDDARDRFLASWNESTRRGANDMAKLVALLRGLAPTPRGLEGAAFDGNDLDHLIRALQGAGPQPGAGDPDDAPDLPDTPVTKPGDIWQLGPHRLICGDATDPAVIARLTGGRSCQVLWTDPPYGVGYTGKTAKALTIEGDDEASLPDLLAGSFKAATAVLDPGAAVYVAHPPGGITGIFLAAFSAAGWRYHQGLVWVKDVMVLGHSDYHYQHEPIAYGWTAGGGRRGRGGKGWFGDNAQVSVFAYPKPPRSEVHPNMKPVGLIAAQLANSCPPSGAVLDVFAGSGSTIAAAHRLAVPCFAAELDPRYCDVIVERIQAFAEVTPERVA